MIQINFNTQMLYALRYYVLWKTFEYTVEVVINQLVSLIVVCWFD